MYIAPWIRKIRYWPRHVFYGLQNLWDYFLIVWRDRDWDWVYLAMLMEFKIKRMADSIEKYGHHTGAAEDVKNMRLCVALLKRIIDDDYPQVRDAQGELQLDYMMNQDEELLFKTMRKHWREWWD